MFKCKQCNIPDENNTLVLIVTTTESVSFNINDDGTLECIDTDGADVEMYLECPVCGQKYAFENEDLFIEKVEVLRLMDYHGILRPLFDIKEDLRFIKKED